MCKAGLLRVRARAGDTADVDWGPRKAELDRLHRAVRVGRVRSLVGRWMLDAFRPPRIAAPAPLPAIEPGQLAITFGGHASVLLRTAGLTIAFDPMLGRWAGGAHRALASALTPGHLAAVGLVLISHAHRDHLHLPSLALVPRTATVIVPPGVGATVSPFGFARVVELQPGAELVTDGVRVVATPLDHGRDPLARALGYVVVGDGASAFLCGDAGYSPAFAQIGAAFAPDVAFLPIGGFLPWSFRARHMSPLDALFALEDLGARLMIPIHHGAFALSYERLDEPERWLRALIAERGLTAHVKILPAGGSEVFAAPVGEGRESPSPSPNPYPNPSPSPYLSPYPNPSPNPMGPTTLTGLAPPRTPTAPPVLRAPAPPAGARPPTVPPPAAPWGPAPSSAAIAVPAVEAAPAVPRTPTPRVGAPEAFDDETVVEPAPGTKLGAGWPRLPR